MTKPTLIERLIAAGYPREDIYHHRSDLYIYVTPLTKKVVDEWFKEIASGRLSNSMTDEKRTPHKAANAE